MEAEAIGGDKGLGDIGEVLTHTSSTLFSVEGPLYEVLVILEVLIDESSREARKF